MGDQDVLTASINDFFVRAGLTPQDQLECFTFVRQLYPESPSIIPAPYQGYCSLTIFVGSDTVVQFRPYGYRLDLRITEAAQRVYGIYAPATRYITTLGKSELLVYSMKRLQGVSFKEFRERNTKNANSLEHLSILCQDFATFLSLAWTSSTKLPRRPGVVGNSISSRLIALGNGLPPRFRDKARQVLRRLHEVEDLPWILTHGDIVPSNIMIDPSTGRLLGLVDWAEAENLPFGISMYGLEEIIGEVTSTGFEYHSHAQHLRQVFWDQLKRRIPELHNKRILQAVELARDVGVLLWHGIAFDNGAINRIVEEGKDQEEIMRLDAFLKPQTSELPGDLPKL